MIVIRGGRVLNAATRRADHADILIDGDTILEIGSPALAAPDDATVVAAEDRLLMPGLVNAHTHSHANLPRSLGNRWTLELALNGNPAVRGNMTVEDKYLAAQIGAVEMVSKGCTACYDLFYEFPAPTVEGLNAVAQGYLEVGMRAVVAPMMADRTFYEAVPGLMEALPEALRAEIENAPRLAPWQTSLENARKALHEWQFDRSRVRMAVAPTIPAHCSDDFLVRAANLARDYDTGFHTHLAESKVQAVAGLKRYGKTLTAHLDGLEVLGPNFTAAHGVWLDDEDISRLADSGAAVAHNPASNMRYGSGMARVHRMMESGLNVGVGTDSRSCSDNLNMFEAMRLASFTSRVQGPDYKRWLATDEVLAMATVGSARALGFGDAIGALAPGRKADIVFLNLRNPNYVPLNDVINQIVNAEDGTGVDSVMIGGRMVLERGRMTTVDVDSLVTKIEAAMERLRTANAQAIGLANKLEEMVGSFCLALAKTPYHVHRYCGLP